MPKWEQLIAACEHKPLSQAEAAERLGVGLVTYQRWELGKRKPQPQHMRHICEVFLLPQTAGEHEPSVPCSCFSPVPSTTLARELMEPASDEISNEPEAFIATHLITSLWSLAFQNHSTCTDTRHAIRQAIKDFDAMNTNQKNYQITRREALCSLATLPIITLGLSVPGKVVQPNQYGSAVAHCAASLEACWELGKSDFADDIALAFRSASRYQQILEQIAKYSSQYREEALELATRYALVKTILGRHCAGPNEAIEYARSALFLSQETANVALQLSAYSKLAGTLFFGKRYLPAEKTAQEAASLLENYVRLPGAEPLPPCIPGGIYSTLALMQAKNGHSANMALNKALQIDPGKEGQLPAFIDFKRSSLMLDSGWIYCYQGDQARAREALEQRVDPETLQPKIPQSELGRLETIDAMTISSLRSKDHDMEKTIHLWKAEIAGAKAMKSELLLAMALTTYELMEVVWPGERRIAELRKHIAHWEA